MLVQMYLKLEAIYFKASNETTLGTFNTLLNKMAGSTDVQCLSGW